MKYIRITRGILKEAEEHQNHMAHDSTFKILGPILGTDEKIFS